MGGAVVVLRSGRESKVHKGVRGDYIEIADANGEFRVTRLFREYEMEVHPFMLDPESGDIMFAPDRGGDYLSDLRAHKPSDYKAAFGAVPVRSDIVLRDGGPPTARAAFGHRDQGRGEFDPASLRLFFRNGQAGIP